MHVGVRLSMIWLTNQSGRIIPILEVLQAASYSGWAYNSVGTKSYVRLLWSVFNRNGSNLIN